MPPMRVPETVETERLLLRAPRPQDGSALHAAVLASLPELRHWMTWAREPLDLTGHTENLTRAAEAFAARTELRYLIWDRAGEVLLGSSGFHGLNWTVPKAEIGYWVHSGHTGQGHARETVEALTEVGLTALRFRRIEIRCDARNTASAAVARRAGYALDARLVNDDVAADGSGRLRDTLLFSVVR